MLRLARLDAQDVLHRVTVRGREGDRNLHEKLEHFEN